MGEGARALCPDLWRATRWGIRLLSADRSPADRPPGDDVMRASIRGFTHVSPGVLETRGDPVAIGSSQIAALSEIARSAPAGRARLLLHASRDDALHEMVIALPPESCDHPHINFRSGKSFVALSGQFALLHCSEDGKDIDPIILSAGPWPGERLARLRAPAWHTIVPLAGDTVFLET